MDTQNSSCMDIIDAETYNLRFDASRRALESFDAGDEARRRALSEAKGDEILRADEAIQAAERAVKEAFFEDTRDRNCRENCMLVDLRYIRWCVTGSPGRASMGLARVGFGRYTGDVSPGGRRRVEWLPIMGTRRVDLLKDVHDGKALPDGMVLLGDLGALVPIPADAVIWTGCRF